MTSPFSGSNGKYTGVLTTTVYANDANNLFGGLTFEYKLANDVNSIDALERLTLIDWAASKVAVDNTSPSAVPAFYGDRMSIDTVGFTWFGNGTFLGSFGVIMPGFAGSVLIQSDLPYYTTSVANIIDGGVAMADTFAPTAVPEATTLLAGALLFLPFGVSTLRILRKRSR